ncbi:nitroreductase family protein [Actinopolymorpha alba]|uniref:nitroreductase family protein n=1 Tax=Actinopolymorpha alba TaxID=533267 RepID=UPI0004754BF1|nr:nitroreductase family protein [Actinopolymorpha alba]
MDFQDVVRRRRMVRNFDPRPVDPAVVARILDNAVRAPSAGFSQGWGFLVLDTPEDVARFWEATTPAGAGVDAWSAGMRRAPVLVVPLSCKGAYLDRYAEADKGWTDRDEARWPVPYWHIDTGMAALLMLLTVTDEGLGGCFFGIPPEQIPSFRKAFGVPEDHTPIGVVALGHPAPDRRSPSLKRGRRSADEVVHRGRW